MRRYAPLAALLLLAGAAATAQAQAPTAPVTPIPQGLSPQEVPSGPAAAPHRTRKTLQQRFDAANIAHDGHLTPEQAQANWPSVAKHFSAIDKDNRGYVTLDDIRRYRAERRRQRSEAPKP